MSRTDAEGPAPVAEPIPVPRPGRSRADLWAALACAAVGLLLAVAPHLTMLARTGDPSYLADDDDLFYLAVGRIPYPGEPALRDPFSSRDDHVPCLFAWFQFVPLAWLTRVLGLPPTWMSLVWRAVGGPLLGGSVWLLFRRLLAGTRHPTAWALGCSLIALSDPGLVQGRPLVDAASLVRHMAAGTTPMPKADALGQYRVVTPLLNLPAVLLLAACLHPAAPSRRRATLAGAVLLGLCFLLYFYFWTAAVAALCGYLASLLALAAWDRRERSSHLARARLVAAVLIGGTILGAPQVVSNARTFADPGYKPILARLGRGCPVPTGDPVRAMYLRNVWAWGKIVAGGAALVALRLRGLALVWWLTAAGFALANSALVTGLEFENFHWNYISAPFGEVLLLAIAAWVLDGRPAARRVRAWLWLVPALTLAIAAAWRPYEALTAPGAVEGTGMLRSLRGLRPALEGLGPDAVLAGAPEARAALLWTRGAILYESPYTSHGSLIPDEEVDQRHALNAWLRGMDLEEYRREVRLHSRVHAAPIDVPRWRPAAVAQRRLAIFAALPRDGGDLLRRFHPDALLLPATAPAPTRGGPWRRRAATREWALWVKPAGGEMAAGAGRSPSPPVGGRP